MATATIANVVREQICDVLCVDSDAATPDARWFEDLDGESIDLLDLGFRLGKLYSKPIEVGRQLSGEIDTDARGIVSEAFREKLRSQFPFLPLNRLPAAATAEDLKQLLTVDVITRFVEMQVNQPVATS
ncbi:MAG: hypothetical protein IT450_13650 [Phycisphaerales bacterium]|nr:hypothetical protein [Phycisphaerales bacterium]